MMKKLTMNKKKYRITGFTKASDPKLAIADFYYPKGKMKGWHPVKNYQIRRNIAKKLGK